MSVQATIDAAKVLIHCPGDGTPIWTGVLCAPADFAAFQGDHLKADCSACGGTHLWAKADAFQQVAT